MSNYLQKTVEYNRKIVQDFLKERASDVRQAAYTNSVDYLKETANLKKVFDVLNLDGPNFTDLGLISKAGKHLSYIGPYDLMGNDYSETFWFKEVMKKGVFISDVFMGYRKVPHFIFAVLCSNGGEKHVLRATVYGEFLNALVEPEKFGQTGEVFLVNREGVYQTVPRFQGRIMEPAQLPMDLLIGESGIFVFNPLEPEGSFNLQTDISSIDPKGLMQSSSRQVIAYSWMKNPDWALVLKQDLSEAFQDVNHVNTVILVLLHSSILAIVIISVFSARNMIKRIKKRDQEAEVLNRQLMQAGKLASIGELAAGVAHEINNPLAVIQSAHEIIRAFTEDEPGLHANFRDKIARYLSQIDTQVERCSHITQNLLRYSRKASIESRSIDLNGTLKNAAGILEESANRVGVKIFQDLEDGLPSLSAYPVKLEQVFLNLIKNAIDAHDGMGYGSIHILTRFDSTRNGFVITIADVGSGIPDKDLERIFDPFFTTKPVGKGTGLGLSLSYSIIKQMGGDISVRSEVGKGTEFTVFLPGSGEVQSENLEDSRKDALDEKA